MQPTIRVGIDVGGTFTDFVVFVPGREALASFKLPSTPASPARAVLDGVAQLPVLVGDPGAGDSYARHIVHGSTVATNALLERKGAPTALVTTRGFRDVLQIGRQNRPALYDLFADPPPPLVPEHWRLEVDERVDHQGQVLQALDPAQVEALIPTLQVQGVTAVAVSLLFSFLHPAHEKMVGEALRQAGFFVSLSSEVLPEFREYERTSTTVVNAYVAPVMDRYLGELGASLGEDELRIMQSNGGSISPAEARRHAVRGILSGPAGGVVGAQRVSQAAGYPRLISFDMGGTSTDVSLCDGDYHLTTEANVGGLPIRIPVLDIHTVGSGGGSIAYVDSGGALRVGPESAGAEPGPACYGRGDRPTVTDANLVLGRLLADRFLGGQMPLQEPAAWRALETLGTRLGLGPQEAALGVIEVVNAHMARALRVISVARGHDPADFTLVSFGGAGGLHAADLARGLGIPRVLVPPYAATLSALGMLLAEVIKDYSLTVMLPGDTPQPLLETRFAPLLARAAEEMGGEGLAPEQVTLETRLDMRYQGQSYELTVPFGEGVNDAFHQAHQAMYGYSDPRVPVEIVNLRVRAVGQVPAPSLPRLPEGGKDPAPALIAHRVVRYPHGAIRVPFYQGEALMPNNHIAGPAVVVRADTTILIGARDQAVVDGYGNLLLAVAPG